MSLVIVLGFIVTHYLADWVAQTDQQALNKSTSNEALFDHVFGYSLVLSLYIMVLSLFGVFSFTGALLFLLVNFGLHFGIDYVTSRMTAKYHKAENRRAFFLTIGADQVAHYICLFLTFYGLSRPVWS